MEQIHLKHRFELKEGKTETQVLSVLSSNDLVLTFSEKLLQICKDLRLKPVLIVAVSELTTAVSSQVF